MPSSTPRIPGRPARLAGAPPGPRQRDLRLTGLLDAAAALFVEQGVAATSIEDIAGRAGVAKGTFYHYFHDRAAMLEALRKRYSQHFADLVEAAMAACGPQDWDGRLAAWTRATVKEYLATYPLHDAIFHDPVVTQRCVISEEAFVVSLAALLHEGAAHGAWSIENPVSTAAFMFHGMHGLLDEAIATGADTAMPAECIIRLFGRLVRCGE
ncbi:MAG: TetR/AcrR family transcriptional regulator [Novosphingobium sp.]|jgi:AcrR family transcriptional regulator|nr:TetR/AcrR family transcriptional regulator [Novosphingobium sp.]